LHLGSLLAAAGSWLDARHHGGQWLLRIEDLDAARVIPGAADGILRTLESLGLHWDGAVVYQSQRLPLYQEALATLAGSALSYPCSCSRRELGATDDAGGYPGTCREGPTRSGPTALRFRTDRCPVEPGTDALQGPQSLAAVATGDPIVLRRDGIVAYQLAVVVDDAAQGINTVVRGADLLHSTIWQRSLQRALGYDEPRYAHLPLLCEADGAKLSKSARAVALPEGADQRRVFVRQALHWLNQELPPEAEGLTVRQLWDSAALRWDRQRLRGLRTIRIS
jgi:glutamyl-Q tRNA(Asp) synthetase